MSKFVIVYASSEGLKEPVQAHIFSTESLLLTPNTKNGH